MTHKIGNRVVIAREPEKVCELCGVKAETRPYGPNGERVCFACGMKNEGAAILGFVNLIAGDKPN